jgi:hypothetical protein
MLFSGNQVCLIKKWVIGIRVVCDHDVEHWALVLQVKWFVRVLNLDGPLWCCLIHALLERHLFAIRRVPSDLLAGSVSDGTLRTHHLCGIIFCVPGTSAEATYIRPSGHRWM